MSVNKPYILSVLAGPNTGAVVALPSGMSTVGSGVDCSIVLDDLPETSVSLGLSGDRVRVLTTQENVTVRGLGPVLPNTKVAATLPAVVRLNENILLGISNFGNPNKQVPFWSFLLVGLAIGALFYFERMGAFKVIQKRVEELSIDLPPPPLELPVQTEVVKANAMSATVCDADCLAEAKQTLQTMISDANLRGFDVEQTGRLLQVTGAVTNAEQRQWSAILREFEAKFGRSISVVVNLTERPTLPKIDVVTVWMGPRPEVRLRDGSTLYLGSKTKDGWLVVGISESGIALIKNTFSHLLPL